MVLQICANIVKSQKLLWRMSHLRDMDQCPILSIGDEEGERQLPPRPPAKGPNIYICISPKIGGPGSVGRFGLRYVSLPGQHNPLPRSRRNHLYVSVV